MKHDHYRPNGRPAHPKCKLKGNDQTTQCSCSRLWNYWDGTERGAEALARSLELSELAPIVSERIGDEVLVFDTPNDTGGFYKDSELMKTALDNKKD
jgi:hypothetical protein